MIQKFVSKIFFSPAVIFYIIMKFLQSNLKKKYIYILLTLHLIGKNHSLIQINNNTALWELYHHQGGENFVYYNFALI